MEIEEINTLLVRKYDQPIPRYTSYPTVPFWKPMDAACWADGFKSRFESQNHVKGISLYIHLPFCESLCTYCGCNKKITTNHKVEDEYLLALEKEWGLYRKMMKQTPVIRELHLGGGTPTFFSPKNLKRLLDFILKGCVVHPQHEFSIEGHPNNTSVSHLKVLYQAGFRRISYGVQDNDPEVQRIINRVQPFENLKAATENARAAGFTSINFDLIYGLPLQTKETIAATFYKVMELKPDRIAFYSYAHVPWNSKGQRLFDEADLPMRDEKLALYIKGKEILKDHGYADIGMDHFALPTDELYKARQTGVLHRNFMGYTTKTTGLLLGLGVSSISDTGSVFSQNHKTLHAYYQAINSGILPTFRGQELTSEDLTFREYITNVACNGETYFHQKDLPLLEQFTFPALTRLEKDGLIEWNSTKMKLTSQGHYFIRNVCNAFDLYMARSNKEETIFSRAI